MPRKKAPKNHQVSFPSFGERSGKRLFEERTKKGLTQLKVAELLDVQECTVSRWEKGERVSISPDYCYKLSVLFGVTFEYMAGMNVPRVVQSKNTPVLYDNLVTLATQLNDSQLAQTIQIMQSMITMKIGSENTGQGNKGE